MQKTGYAELPLHGGKAPKWLFGRMVKLSGEIARVIVLEYSQRELLEKLADPYWFQAFGCVLGFDWHSSGVTTTTMGALKEALNKKDLGVKVAGGKGAVSRKAPEEICEYNLTENKTIKLQRASKLSAKVDNSLLQDSFQLYHHTFVFTERGEWAVVQQGMNLSSKYARRYHWLSSPKLRFMEDPQTVCCDLIMESTLNLSAKDSEETRRVSLDLVRDNPEHLRKYLKPKGQTSLLNYAQLKMPEHHFIRREDLSEGVIRQLKKAYELQPSNYEELVMLRGMGPKSVRALALISELVYGTKASWRDPVKYAYAHGGKDGTPYPVDRETYDKSIFTLKEAVEQAELNRNERLGAIKRLSDYITP